MNTDTALAQPTPTSWPHPDTSARYGTVTRVLHWAMALCFAVVFFAAIVRYFMPDTPAEEAVWPLHKPTGALLLLLIVLRTLWALVTAGRRPAAISGMAQLGHLAMYLLMWAIPVIALIRQYGSANAFSPFGIPLVAQRPETDKVEWMTELGGLLHGELGWALLALIVGHIAMALWHRRSAQNVLPRIIG